MTTLNLAIDGMSCHHCLNAVNQALSTLPGVSITSVRIGRAELAYDPAAVDQQRIVSALGDAGYRAHPIA